MTIKASNYPTSRPTLNLDFAKSKQLDPRITFSRASSATFVDADGLIKNAASGQARFDHDPSTGESLGLLVENARTNGVKRSQNISRNTNLAEADRWEIVDRTQGIPLGNIGTGTWIPNSAIAPDGTITASFFSAIGVNVLRSPLVVPGNNIGQAYDAITVDLDSGTIVSANANGSPATITPAGNGWYRITWTGYGICSVYAKKGSTNILKMGFNTFFAGLGFTFSTGGTEGQGVYIWGAQHELLASFPTSYIPTPATFTSRASTATYYDASGVIQTAGIDVARDNAYFPDENGVMQPAGLLLEGSGTNLLTYSEQFNTAPWTTNNATVTANDTTAPDGNTTADKVIVNNGATVADIRRTALSTNGVVSFYAKAGGFDYIGGEAHTAAGGYPKFRVDLLTGISSTSESSISISTQNAGNSWWRISVVGNFGGNAFIIQPRNDYNFYGTAISGADGVKGAYLWGAQLETGSYPTSYIPTTSSTVTRAADVSSSPTVTRARDVASIATTGWMAPYIGTIATEYYRMSLSSFFVAYLWSLGGGNPALTYTNTGLNSDRDFAGGGQGYMAFPIVAGKNKAAFAFENVGQWTTTGNGATPISSIITAPWNTLPTTLDLGSGATAPLGGTVINAPLSRLTYWPTRLSDATLQAITR